ncbi:MAG: YkgJ family cysteine cluster protein [Candidatus Nezhaarchaeales archaeon]
MGYVPWRSVKGWVCLGCGECCKRYRVFLTAYEYVVIIKRFGSRFIDVSKTGDLCLKRVEGTCVFQDVNGLCQLQPLGLKPLACKVWPFKVQDAPAKGFWDEYASFNYADKTYYVYVNTDCNGINNGTFNDLIQAIREVIEIHRNPWRPQFYSTSRRVTLGLELQGIPLYLERPTSKPLWTYSGLR